MNEYLIQGETLTSIGDEIRTLSGVSDFMMPNEMISNLGDANAKVDDQAALIAEISAILDDKLAASVSIGTVTVTPNSNSTSISFTGLSGEPKMFCIIPTGNISLSSNSRYVINVVYDGSTVRGVYSNNSTAYHSTSYFTQTYSNGTLMVRTSSSTNGGNFRSGIQYQLVYVV